MKKDLNRIKAENIRDRYNIILAELASKSRNGYEQAALDIMSTMTKERLEIRKTGFELGFDTNNIVTRKHYMKCLNKWEKSQHYDISW